VLTEGAPPTGAPGTATTQLQKSEATLITAIPTEVLAPYTAIVAVIIGNATTSDRLTALRWTIYGVALAFIVVYEAATYLRSQKRTRRLPWLETLVAAVAFAAWGLAMPGSPLTISMKASDFAIAAAIIAIGAAALLTLLSPPLNAAPKTRSRTPP
jgi:fucose 4-O-acetylase-like acetyltransferase